uniref:Alternative protein GINS1 n=1 Tax=Homo sapiens TaxID=9606 RepID=L8ECJ2_HUMAN|nr:alternative protein GINS1 [Homo sapiens]
MTACFGSEHSDGNMVASCQMHYDFTWLLKKWSGLIIIKDLLLLI